MKDDNDKKLAFVQAMTKHGLSHFATGGTTEMYNSPNPGNVGGSNQQGSIASSPGWMASGAVNPIGSAGGSAQGIASAFTAQNQYSADLAPTDYTSYGNYINQAGQNSLSGYGQAQNIQGQQQSLANNLGQQTQGFGPNVAVNQLNTKTGENVANQAALMAGGRGASSNAGLAARQAAGAGTNVQQQAVGEAATLRAQQQQAAIQQLAAQQQVMGQQNIGEQGINNQLFGGAASAQNAQNNANISNYGMAQGINSQIAQNNANSVNKTTSGLMGGASQLGMMAAMSKGGIAGKDGYKMEDHHKTIASIYHPHMMADGGAIFTDSSAHYTTPTLPAGQGVDMPKMPKMPGQGGGGSSAQSDAISNTDMSNATPMAGESSGLGSGVMVAKKGGSVPGKAKVKGDSLKNDTVPAMLSAGEIVLPRHITQDSDAPRKAAEFVSAILAKKGKRK